MMTEIFRKGQLVPKRIGHVKCHKKVRHHITFGADVLVSGNAFTLLKNTGKCIFECKEFKRKRNNGTYQKMTIAIRNVQMCIEQDIDYQNKEEKTYGVYIETDKIK